MKAHAKETVVVAAGDGMRRQAKRDAALVCQACLGEGTPRRAWLAAAIQIALLLPGSTPAQLEVVPDPEPLRVFAGEARTLAVRFHNAGRSPVSADIRTGLYQASSATAMLLREAPWKRLEVLPAQTVLESARLTFPPVRAETRFVVQWLQDTNKVFGTTEVLAYPSNLLSELKCLAGEEPLGMLDPGSQLKPVLKASGVEYQDLDNIELDDYAGRLAIVGPFQSRAQMREGLPGRVKALAAKGTAVLWIQPPPEKPERLKPSFYTVPQGKGTVVVVQPWLVARPAEDPQTQLYLIELARLALHPAPPRLPQLARSQ